LGRIKTTFIKSIGQELYEKHPDKFTDDYSKNKKVINELVRIESKKLKNVITGYVTSLKKQSKR